jgi:hypothetical protein
VTAQLRHRVFSKTSGLLDSYETTVDGQVDAADKAAFVAGEEESGSGDLFCAAHALHGDDRIELVSEGVGGFFRRELAVDDGCFDWARADDV